MRSIVVTGSLAFDQIMNMPGRFADHILPDKLHILNVSFLVDTLRRERGGTAGNIAYTMKLLGVDSFLVSTLGKDGGQYLEHLRSLGINIENVITDDKQNTAAAYITTDADDNQITAFFNGPLYRSLETEVDRLPNLTLALISPTYKEVMKKHLLDCFQAGIKTVFDPGQQMTAFDEMELKKMISQAHFVVGNDYEIKLLQERTGWDSKEMLKNCKVLITTLGEKGSVIMTADGETVEVGACAPQSFDDPTGAGDAYRAGFFVGYELGYNWKTCGQMGAVAASYAIESYGTQAHKFTKEEFSERYQKSFNEKLAL